MSMKSMNPLKPQKLLQPLLLLALSAWLCSACATSRRGEAEVRMEGGKPCFTLTAKEAKRDPGVRLQAVIVSDASSKPVAKAWSMSVDPAQGAPMSNASCIAYGQVPPGAETRTPPAPLQPDRVYLVYLNGRPSDPSDPTHGYGAKFCLASDGAQGQRLVPLKIGSREWIDEVCR